MNTKRHLLNTKRKRRRFKALSRLQNEILLSMSNGAWIGQQGLSYTLYTKESNKSIPAQTVKRLIIEKMIECLGNSYTITQRGAIHVGFIQSFAF